MGQPHNTYITTLSHDWQHHKKTVSLPYDRGGLVGWSNKRWRQAGTSRCLRALRVVPSGTPSGFLALPKKTKSPSLSKEGFGEDCLYRWRHSRHFKTNGKAVGRVKALPKCKHKKKTNPFWIGLEVAATYSPTTKCSTIGVSELNFSVRNGKRWDLAAITT